MTKIEREIAKFMEILNRPPLTPENRKAARAYQTFQNKRQKIEHKLHVEEMKLRSKIKTVSAMDMAADKKGKK